MRKRILLIVTIALALISVCLYFKSHTVFLAYYKADPLFITYNDWWIKGKTIEEIKEKYGERQKWEKREPDTYYYEITTTPNFLGISRWIEWYCMEVDESGTVTNIFARDALVQ